MEDDCLGFLRFLLGPRDLETLLAVRVGAVGESDDTVLEFPDSKGVDEVCRIALKSKPRRRLVIGVKADQGCPLPFVAVEISSGSISPHNQAHNGMSKRNELVYRRTPTISVRRPCSSRRTDAGRGIRSRPEERRYA